MSRGGLQAPKAAFDLGLLLMSEGTSGGQRGPASGPSPPGTPTRCLVREIGEKSGLTISAAEGGPFHVSGFVKEPLWVMCVMFACPSIEGEVRLSDEHDEHRWVVPGKHRSLSCATAIEEQLDASASLR
jgi:hypothetical protein